MDPAFLETIEERLEDLPDEVRDFLFGDDFTLIQKDLGKIFENENDAINFSNQIRLLILGGISKEELAKQIQTLQLAPVKKEELIKYVDEKIIEDLLLLTEVTAELESNTQEKKSTEEKIEKKRPTDGATDAALANLGSRLLQPSIITPEKRTYTIEKEGMAQEPKVDSRSIDPYHEPIDAK